jgi:hypothetical protein
MSSGFFVIVASLELTEDVVAGVEITSRREHERVPIRSLQVGDVAARF